MGSEDQAHTVQSKKRKTNHHQGKHFHPRRSSRNLPKFRCYTCDERGHFAKYCPRNKNNSHKKKGNKRRHHAHAAEDYEPSTKRILCFSVSSLPTKYLGAPLFDEALKHASWKELLNKLENCLSS